MCAVPRRGGSMKEWSSFPRELPDQPPHEAQLVKEIWEALGCKDDMTRRFIRVAVMAIRVFDWKQTNYGTRNIAGKGAKGVLTRLTDKWSRLDNIYENRREDEEHAEPVEDSFGDIGNYGLIGLMCRYGLWPGSPEEKKAETIH